MANTYTLIASNTLSSSAASVTFSSIPATYTDLVLRCSNRCDVSGTSARNLIITLNGTTSGSSVQLRATGTTVSSALTSSTAYIEVGLSPGAGFTADTFSSNEVYIPNYAGSTNKPFFAFDVVEINSASSNHIRAYATLQSQTTAITSITIAPQSYNFVSGSSFFLYGIKNS